MAEPSVGPTPYVFLSYASAEQDRALAVSDALQQAGIAVWLDRHAIVGGSAWSTAIVRGIKDCAVFLVLGSERAFRSPNVQRELNLAVEENRPLLPLLLEQVQPPDDVRYALAGRQWVLLLDRPAETWLSDVLRALAGLGVLPRTMPLAPDAPVAVSDRPPTNFPTTLARLLGRERELADISRLLATERLVTLTGPGGTGKTQLALTAALAQSAVFPDGVFFVDLAPLADPAFVPSVLALVLGVQERADLSPRESVLRFLRDRHLLLLLDNYEHLLAAAEFAGSLLQAGPSVSLLVTSRAPLRVSGEREYAVAPLVLPEIGTVSAAELGQNPAVALFVLRAQAVRADFALSDESALAVATICARLDGLPLAIELAAARVRVLPPVALLARLTQRLPLLTGGRRDVPTRQQTLRDAIAWSYALLEPGEQRLLRRLSVFAGGCTLELAEAVANGDGDLGIDLLNGVGSLAEKSLLRESESVAGEPRYRMLETIREFAAGELETSGEAEAVRRQMAVQMLQAARRSALMSGWTRLDGELDNVRGVLGWCVARAELAMGARLFWAVRDYLYNRGLGNERNVWRNRLLALPEAAQPSISRARLLAVASVDVRSAEEWEHQTAEVEEAATLSRTLGDAPCLALALNWLALVRINQEQYDAAVPLATEALALYLPLGSPQAALMQGFLMIAALNRGDRETAAQMLAANRTLEGANRSFYGLGFEAGFAEAEGDDARARVFLEQAVRKSAADLGETAPSRLMQLAHLARIMLRQGDIEAAIATCQQSLLVQHSIGPTLFLSLALDVLAQAAEHCDLLGASTRLFAAVGVQLRQSAVEAARVQRDHEPALKRLRVALDPATFAEAWAAGESLSADDSIEYGLGVVAQLDKLLIAQGTVAGSAN